jgi:hypothetical protein
MNLDLLLLLLRCILLDQPLLLLQLLLLYPVQLLLRLSSGRLLLLLLWNLDLDLPPLLRRHSEPLPLELRLKLRDHLRLRLRQRLSHVYPAHLSIDSPPLAHLLLPLRPLRKHLKSSLHSSLPTHLDRPRNPPKSLRSPVYPQMLPSPIQVRSRA